ncbi:unannotated protein [freshwater metagenome]|uniref:Unannotated protein n=1 Tax=freshwater metagenome TaxID=449393 RepID=A0A6J6VXI8_9ZZZZ
MPKSVTDIDVGTCRNGPGVGALIMGAALLLSRGESSLSSPELFIILSSSCAMPARSRRSAVPPATLVRDVSICVTKNERSALPAAMSDAAKPKPARTTTPTTNRFRKLHMLSGLETLRSGDGIVT